LVVVDDPDRWAHTEVDIIIMQAIVNTFKMLFLLMSFLNPIFSPF